MKILVVLPRFPYPLTKGDKLRAYHQIEELSKHHQIYLFCVSHKKVPQDDIDALQPFCKDIKVVKLNRLACYKNVIANWFASKSLQMGYWNTAHSKLRYKQFEKKVQPDIVYNQMVRTMPLVARSKYPKVMDFQDALSLNAERSMDYSRGFWRYILHFEFKMLRSSEYNAFSIFDGLTIISEYDSEAIPHKKSRTIKIIPNGVDLNFFNRERLVPNKTSVSHDLLFCGNLSYDPNINAVAYLINEIMPLVWQRRPQTTLLIAGTSPKAKVKRLSQHKNITLTGWMEDIRQAYTSAKVFVAPMQIGSGLQNKLLEAMAMQLPCITTSISNQALNAEHGKEIIIADDRQTFADQIIALLDNPSLADTIAQNGNRFVADHHQWADTVAILDQFLTEKAQQRL
ncbi:MAG: glycosyltransferase [Bacteroidales bacterium]|nr:glycosyltransferase [Bacteroidales bacterium]